MGVPTGPGGFDVVEGIGVPGDVLAVIEPGELFSSAGVDPSGLLPPLGECWPVLGAVGEWDEVDEGDVGEEQ